jgi:multidrug resistance protein, MATE family
MNKFLCWQTSKRIFSLALPMAGSQFLNVGSGFLCMGMLAHLGHQVLAASALISATQLSIMVSGLSILFSLSVLIGHAYGAKDYPVIGNYLRQAWLLGILIGIPIIIFFWHIGAILIFFGQSPAIANIVQYYFHAYVWAVIFWFLSTCNQQFGYAIGKKKLIVTASAISIIILLTTAYIFIFGKLGISSKGVAGLGYALTAQAVFFFVFTTLVFYYGKDFKPFELFSLRAQQQGEYFKKMFKIGWPICVQMGGEMLSLFVSGILIGWLGITALAAFQIVNQYYFLIIVPIFSLSQASGILVGQARGAKQFHEIKKLSHASITIVLIIGLIIAGAFLLFPKHLAAFYLDVTNPTNSATLHLTILIFMIIAFSQLLDGLRNILIGILRGMFDTRFPMYTSLLTIWLIGMPLSYMLAFPLHLGAVGFVIGGMLGMLGCAAVMLYRWQKLLPIMIDG